MTTVALRASVTQAILILVLAMSPCYGQLKPATESGAQISVKQDSSSVFSPEKLPVFDPVMLLAKTLAAVAVFSLLLYLVLRMLRGAVYRRGSTISSMGIKVVGSVALGPKKSLCLVRVLGHILVLGMSEAEITLLFDVPIEELNEEQQNSLLAGNAPQTPNFKKTLSSWLSK